MSEQERAVADAEARGRAAAAVEYGERLAAARFAAVAAGKLADPTAHLETMDLKKLLDDKGQPDETLIAAAVERLAKAGPPASNGDGRPPWLPQGVQGGGQPADSDWLRSVIHR
jgi:hypothetical protein